MLIINFNGVTVRVIYTTKSLKFSLGGGEEKINVYLLFYIDPLSPGSPHPQALGGGLSLSVMHTEVVHV